MSTETPTATAEPTAPAPFTHRQILVTMSGLVIAMLLAMLDNMIVAPALPTIVGDLGGLSMLAWVTTGYILASTVSTPIWGKLGDLFGRRATFLSSVGVFLVGSVLAGLSQNMTELIAFRAVQGLGSGGLMVGVLAIIGEMIPPRERSRYMGLMMAVMPVAMIGGPLAGGFITDHLSWRWAFYVNLPLGVVTMVLCWFTLAALPRGTGKAKIDWSGAALLTVWITALVLITSWGGTKYAWASPQILGLAAVVVAGFIAFVAVQRRTAEPIMPLRVFGNLNFTLAGTLAFISGFALFGAVTFLPQYQQFVQGSSATNSGLLLMPMMIAAMVVSLASGTLISRTGNYKPFPIIGGTLMAAALALFATVDVDTSKTATALYMVLLGIGMGCLMQTSTLIAQNSLEPRDIGAGTGASMFLRNMGSSLGVSLLGAIYTNSLAGSLSGFGTGQGTQMTPAALKTLPETARQTFQHAVTDGVGTLFAVAAAVAAIGVVVAVFIKKVPLRGGPQATTATSNNTPQTQAAQAAQTH
ncbi:MDR family MFS transporter [Actinokineospora sp. NBRC 105648]|uniref:MDR family MFS transporter n=1 Tax=Actinokineospora sp. NBRC 105648 TaxID=3032206 RepID=UPI0024A0E8F3|nr:MDR family MFS transporter [Actinokineospora sp. NBRC 105648]GLZ41070.1 MFS transporter [Actinokineospora sp. NBRC 105648]